MSNLEQIVRPSQSPDIRPAPTTALLEPPKTVNNPNVVWGTSGNSIFQLRAHASGQVDNRQDYETSRKFDVVRVKNPDDENQYIDVEVMTEYQARNKIDDSRTKLRFDKPKAKDNIEIISRDNTRSSTNTGD